MVENFAIVLELLKEYGDFWRLWTGPELNIIVQDPNDVEVVEVHLFIFEKSASLNRIERKLSLKI